MKNLPSMTGNPYRDLMALQHFMDRAFDPMWSSVDAPATSTAASMTSPAFAPSCDLEETDTHYLMSFDLPGVKKENIKVDLQNGTLTVSGERQDERTEKRKSYSSSERYYGSFARSFRIPETVKPEQIEAAYTDGVLRLAVPKAKATQAQTVKIGEGKPSLWEKLIGHNRQKEGTQPPPQEKRSPEKVA